MQTKNSAVGALSAKDLTALIETARDINATVTLENLLQRILERAGELTNAPDTSIILRREQREALYVAAATGSNADSFLATFGPHALKDIPIEESMAGQVYSSGQSRIDNRVEKHFKGVDEETGQTTRSMVCVPLIVGDERLGVVQLLNKRSGEFDERDRLLLEHFAAQAAVAIRNAQLFESLLAHSGLYASQDQTSDMVRLMRELGRPAHFETLSVLFADMRGFTQLSQSLNPVIVQERVSEFISMLSDSVIEHRGIVNKFLGDGVMSLFRDDDFAVRAVRCAFDMTERFTSMKQCWDESSNQQLDFLDIGIGIVTDQVILGGMGSARMRDFTAIGTAVNLAAALEREARDGRQILTDQLTLSSVKNLIEDYAGPDDFELRKPGQTIGVKYKCYHLKKLAQPRKTTVFISHNRADREFVEHQLVGPLNQRGIRTWYASDDIPKGVYWPAEIRRALADCNWMLVVVSRNSANSEWVSREVDLVIATHRQDRGILPLILDDTEPGAVNDYLAPLQGIDARGVEDLAAMIAEHITTLSPA